MPSRLIHTAAEFELDVLLSLGLIVVVALAISSTGFVERNISQFSFDVPAGALGFRVCAFIGSRPLLLQH